MADSVITLKDQKFRKVKGVWVDQKKTPAPKDLIGLLDKLSTAEAAAAGPEAAKEDKPALPVLPIAAKDFSTAKLESSINRLAKIVENLAKSIEKGTKSSTGANAKDAPSAQRIYEPGKIPTLREAMKLNRQEFFKGTTNKYGEVEQRGLLRDLGSILPSKANKYRAQDRQRAAIGSELREYEGTLQSNPNLSKKQINEKIAEKRKELENPKAVPAKPEPVAQRITKDTAKQVAQMKVANPELTSSKALEQIRSKPAMPEAISAGEKERQKTLVQGKSEFASPDVDKNITSVKITDIDESVLKKLKEIFGRGVDKEAPAIKEEEKTTPSNSAGAGGGFFDRFKRKPPKSTTSAVEKEAKQLLDKNGKPLQGAAKASREAKLAKETASGVENVAEQAAKKPSVFSRISKLFSGNAPAAVEKEAEQLLDKNGKPLRGAAKASREAKLAKEAAESAEQVAKKPGILSRIFGGGAKTVEQATEQVAKKPSILSRIFGGGTKTAGVEGAEQVAKKPSILSRIFGGGSKAAAGTGAKVAEKVAAKGSAKLLGRLGAGFVPGVGGALDIAAAANAAKEGNPLAAALYGSAGALNIGGAAADVTGVGAIGGLPADIIGGVLTAGGMAAEFTGFGKTKPKPAMIKPAGVTPQTQVLTATTKRVEAAKEQKATAAPTVINNNVSSPTNVSSSQGIIGGPTVADRGSLNLASF